MPTIIMLASSSTPVKPMFELNLPDSMEDAVQYPPLIDEQMFNDPVHHKGIVILHKDTYVYPLYTDGMNHFISTEVQTTVDWTVNYKDAYYTFIANRLRIGVIVRLPNVEHIWRSKYQCIGFVMDTVI